VVSFPQVFHQNPVQASPLPIRAKCPAYPILFDFITYTIVSEECRSWSSSLWSFLNSPVTSTLLGRNSLLSTLFSNTLSHQKRTNWQPRKYQLIYNEYTQCSQFSGETHDSAVSMCNRLWFRRPVFRIWAPTNAFSLIRNLQNGSRAHPTSCLTETGVLSRGVSGQRMFTTQLHLAPRFRKTVAIRKDDLYGFTPWTRNNFTVLLRALVFI
jgi:hypothetical protein